MAIELKETVGYANFKLVNDNSKPVEVTESACAVPQQMVSPESLMVEIEGIHSECLTINDTYYTSSCLEKSIPYWTNPYERPVIMHHKDQDGVTIGRIKGAEMVKAEKSRSKTPALSFTCNIGDDNGIKGIKNGTLSTVSIGAMVYDLRCSICNKNLALCVPCWFCGLLLFVAALLGCFFPDVFLAFALLVLVDEEPLPDAALDAAFI